MISFLGGFLCHPEESPAADTKITKAIRCCSHGDTVTDRYIARKMAPDTTNDCFCCTVCEANLIFAGYLKVLLLNTDLNPSVQETVMCLIPSRIHYSYFGP